MFAIVQNAAEQNILSGIFIPLTNYCDLPVLDQISLFFHRENLKSAGFESSRLTGMGCFQNGVFWLHKITFFAV